MKFCDLVQFMHHNYEVKMNAAEFVKTLTDAILDDEALEKLLRIHSMGLENPHLRHITAAGFPFHRKRRLHLHLDWMRRSLLIL